MENTTKKQLITICGNYERSSNETAEKLATLTGDIFRCTFDLYHDWRGYFAYVTLYQNGARIGEWDTNPTTKTEQRRELELVYYKVKDYINAQIIAILESRAK
jgi:hypothetical protein